MEENKEEKKKKKKGLLIILLTLLGAGVLATGAFLVPKLLKGNQPVESETETTAPEPVSDKVALYYNLDRMQYIEGSVTGLSTRPINKDDGYYHILMATDTGRAVQIRVRDHRIVSQIDNNLIMGLVFDEDNICIGVIPPKECIGSYYGERFFVMEVPEDREHTAIINSSAVGKGIELELSWDENVKLIDVSNYQGAQGNFASNLREDDRVIGILDKDGNLTHVYIIERTDDTPVYTAYCEDCKEEVKWKGWKYTDKLPTEMNRYSHYYLSADIQLISQNNIAKDTKICLDLKGHTVTGAMDKRMYSLHNEGAGLALFDTSEEKTGAFVAWGEGVTEGICVWPRYGTFSMYGGTLDASKYTSYLNGVAVNVPKNSTFNLYGGTVIGGTAESYRYENSSGTLTNRGGLSGAVHISGTVNMYGGEIRDGYVKEVHYKDANGKDAVAMGYGGNIYIGSTGVFNMYGGVIKNGCSYNNGGNIAMEGNANTGAIFHMYDGARIEGGLSRRDSANGGSVSVGTNSFFYMHGGTITGGVSNNCAGNVYVNGTFNMEGGLINNGTCLKNGVPNEKQQSRNLFIVHGKANLSGGEIQGYIWLTHVTTPSEVTVSGSFRCTGGLSNFRIDNNEPINVGKMGGNAKVNVTAGGYFSNVTDASNKQYFVSDIPGFPVQQAGGRLFIGEAHCVCGGSKPEGHVCETKVFAAWTSETSLPTESGYYTLTKDVKCGQQSIKKDAKIVLCLNGHTVTGSPNARIYSLHNEGAELTLTDHRATAGKLVANGDNLDEGACVWLRYGTFNMYNVTLDATNAVAHKSGTAVAVPNGRTFNMYSGTIIGGTNEAFVYQSNGKNTFRAGSAGSVYVAGTMNMYGGTIRDGKAVSVAYENDGTKSTGGGYGGNLYIGTTGVLNLYGGEIKDGSSEKGGGNISTEHGSSRSSEINMTGGTISGGQATVANKDYYNVMLMNDVVLNMSGGEIKGGAGLHTIEGGSPVTFSGTAKVDGFIIPGGKTVSVGEMKEGAAVKVKAEGFFTEETAEANKNYFIAVSGEAVTYANGKLYIGEFFDVQKHCACGGTLSGHACEELTFEPWTSTSGLPTKAGSYYLTKDVTLTTQTNIEANAKVVLCLNGHTVTGAKNLRMYSLHNDGASLVLTDCQATPGKMIAVGDAMDEGACVWLRYGTLDLYNVTLDASAVTSTKAGTAVQVPNGRTFNMYSGTIIGGTAKAVTVNNSDGSVSGRGGMGGAVQVAGTMNLYGGTVEGGKAVTVNFTNGSTNSSFGGYGGNLYIGTTGVLNIYGGEIKNGTADKGGGNISTEHGSARSSAIYMHGGAITGGTAVTANKDYYNVMLMNDVTFEMTDGTLGKGAGLHTVSGGSPVTFSGKAIVEDFIIPAGKTISLKDLADGASITVTASGVFSTKTAEANKSFVKSSDSTLEVSLKKENPADTEGVLVIGRLQCVCGGILEGKEIDGTVHHCAEHMELFGPWKDTTAMPNTTGYYYLTADVKATSQVRIGNGADVVLDLNGYKLTGTSRKALIGYETEGKLTLLDSSEGKTGKILRTTFSADELLYLQSKATLVAYGITFDASNAKGTNVRTLGVAGGAKLTLYECKLLGGNNTGAGGSGAVMSTGKNTVLTMYGGEISGGQAEKGGNLNLAESIVYLKDVTIKDGVAKTEGGNIRSYADTVLEDCVITGGTAPNGGGLLVGFSTCTLKGATTVTGNGTEKAEDNDNNIYVNANTRFTVENCTAEEKSLGITVGGSGRFATAKGTADELAAAEKAIVGDKSMFEIKTQANGSDKDFLCDFVHKHCVCGGALKDVKIEGLTHTCEEVVFTPVSDLSSIGSKASGYYYLTADCTLSSQQNIREGKNIVIDLNGHTVTMVNRFMVGYQTEGTLTITDCSAGKTGKMVKSGTANECLIYMQGLGNVNIYGGTFDCSACVSASSMTAGLRVIRQASSTHTLNIYGGKLLGGDISAPSAVEANRGSVIYSSSGITNIYGGEIVGGKAATGGAIYANSTYRMYGGTIKGGTSTGNGGNVYLTGYTFTMYGGTVEGGKASTTAEGGGNFSVGSSGTLKVLGGTIKDGTALQGGNIRCYGQLYLADCEITGGTTNQNGGGVYMGSYNSNVFEISGDTVVSGNKYKNGASTLDNNIYLESGRAISLKNPGTKLSIGITENDKLLSKVTGATSGMENTQIKADKSTKYTLAFESGNIVFKSLK